MSHRPIFSPRLTSLGRTVFRHNRIDGNCPEKPVPTALDSHYIAPSQRSSPPIRPQSPTASSRAPPKLWASLFLTLDHFFKTLPLFFELGSLFFDLGSLFLDLDLLFLNLGMFLFNLGLLSHTCLESCAILHFFTLHSQSTLVQRSRLAPSSGAPVTS